MSQHHARTSAHRRRRLAIEVAERYGYVCSICRRLIDPHAPLLGDRFSVEHLVPVSVGGPYWDIDNCRPAHQRCNARRGNRTTPAVTSPRSRSW